MESAAIVTIVAVGLIVAALVVYLVSVIVQLRKITAGLDEVIASVGEIVEKSAPVNGVVTAINEQLDAGVDLLEGLLVKKAGMADAVGLVEGLYAGSAAAGFRSFPESTTVKAPRIGEVYTRARSRWRASAVRPRSRREPGRPRAQGHRAWEPCGPPARPGGRQSRPESLARSPIIGTDSPVQYPPSEQRGGTADSKEPSDT